MNAISQDLRHHATKVISTDLPYLERNNSINAIISSGAQGAKALIEAWEHPFTFDTAIAFYEAKDTTTKILMQIGGKAQDVLVSKLDNPKISYSLKLILLLPLAMVAPNQGLKYALDFLKRETYQSIEVRSFWERLLRLAPSNEPCNDCLTAISYCTDRKILEANDAYEIVLKAVTVFEHYRSGFLLERSMALLGKIGLPEHITVLEKYANYQDKKVRDQVEASIIKIRDRDPE